MDWHRLDRRVTNSEGYKFFKKHERLMIFIQGFIVIGLLIGIAIFFVRDYEVKEQIADRCGYTTQYYECVCDANYVANWKELQRGGGIDLNMSKNLNISNNLNISKIESG